MASFSTEENLSIPLLLPRLLYHNLRRPAGLSEKMVPAGPYPAQYALLVSPQNFQHADTLVVFIHGGGWQNGSPKAFRFVANNLAQQGYPVTSLGYRHAPAFQHPAQVDDVFAALRASLDAYEQMGFRPKRIVLMGQSAGGHLAALIALDTERQARYQIHADQFSGLISISGPMDLSLCFSGEGYPEEGYRRYAERLVSAYLGERSLLPDADPLTRLKASERTPLPPVLCLHGDRDPLVPLEGSRRFVEAVNERGGQATLDVLPGYHHSDLVRLFMEENTHAERLRQWIKELAPQGSEMPEQSL